MIQDGEFPRASQRHSLWRDIAWALAVKTIALVVLYFAFFGPSQRVEVTPDRIAAALINSTQIDEGP